MDLFEELLDNPWKENIVLGSLPLWKYENEFPVANASACLVDYKNTRFLLSVAHASIAKSLWRAEVKSVDYDGANFGWLYQPVEMNSLYSFKLKPELNDVSEPKLVDFTYLRVPDNFNSEHVIDIIDNEPFSANRTVFKPNFDVLLSKEKKYGFYGNVRFNGTKDNRLVFDHRLEHDLSYIGTDDEYHVFKLPHKYGSHLNYLGCSGAPIIDNDYNLVALVAFGRRSTNCIYGVDIKKYRSILEINSKHNNYGII
ncbi:hypothetical protein [Fluviicola sp.]|uniref:hypothetical protein n=1 Tax=Fluviicola sp. TaxID=1917219 RepID=UPI003D2B6C12